MKTKLQVVDSVDLSRYAGSWFEIARLPTWFERGCGGSRANYTLRPDGRVEVVNDCLTDSGRTKSVRGIAWVVDPKTNAKLRVRFRWPFWGSYWIIELATDYSVAVVGHPSRKYLWILSRRSQLDHSTYQELLDRIRNVHGYDTSRLVLTRQPQREESR